MFTQKTPVAKVTISTQKSDDNGKYVNVTYTPIEQVSATDKLFNQKAESSNKQLQSTQYKIYGDTVYFSGPIIKFKDELILLNFKTIYKVGKIYGRYEEDNELENARKPGAIASYDIDGGYYDWKSIFDNFAREDIIGGFYRTFIDTTQLKSAGQFVNSKELKYTLYIKNDGLSLELDK